MSKEIALALSGGGVRAMAFHLGVLRFLADNAALERVTNLSTVSGGSLLIGLLFSRNKMRWPTSTEFLSQTHFEVKNVLLSTDIQAGTIGRLVFRPVLWRYVTSRPNIVALAIYEDWRIRSTLSDLPLSPRWSINCTTAETGRRFRFKDGRLGDYETGYADCTRFPLASAMAVSAAFPVGFGPFRLRASRLKWKKQLFWNSSVEQSIDAPYQSLHLYDGGVYDNLGLEPFFDTGGRKPKKGIPPRIIVSDAGAPLTRGFGLGAFNPLRMKRLMDVMMDQNRALRVRTFVNYVAETKQGAYIGIQRTANLRTLLTKPCSTDRWLTEEEAAYVSAYSTSLNVLEESDFTVIEAHGYQTAQLTEIGFPFL